MTKNSAHADMMKLADMLDLESSAKAYRFKSCPRNFAQIAQLVEQGTENPCVAGSIPALGIFIS